MSTDTGKYQELMDRFTSMTEVKTVKKLEEPAIHTVLQDIIKTMGVDVAFEVKQMPDSLVASLWKTAGIQLDLSGPDQS